MPKRDLDRIREILLHIESQGSDDGNVGTIGDPFYQASDAYQITLLEQGGYMEVGNTFKSSIAPDPLQITFAGHDFLVAIRDDGICRILKTQSPSLVAL
jgi:hypothetical protein